MLLTTGRIVFDGNSLTVGDESPYPTQLLAALDLPAEVETANFAVIGSRTTSLIIRAPQVDALYVQGEQNVLFVWEILNHLRSGVTADEALATWKSYCRARRAVGWTVFAFTLTPANGTGLADFATTREYINDNLRATADTYCDALVDVAADPIIGDEGAQDNATYYTDGLHLTPAGYAIVAQIALDALDSYTEPDMSIELIADGENRSADVLNRPIEQMLDQSGYEDDGSDFAGFAKATAGNGVADLATEATALETPRNINGVAFDGSAAINTMVGVLGATGSGANGSAVGTSFYTQGASSASANESARQFVIPRNCTLRNFFWITSATQPVDGADVITIRKNGVDTAITVTVGAGAPAATFSDTTHAVDFVAGDLFSIKHVNASASPGSAYTAWAISLDGV